MFIIYKGYVQVLFEGSNCAPIYIEAGDVFGQTALQNHDPRNATIVARSEVECLILYK